MDTKGQLPHDLPPAYESTPSAAPPSLVIPEASSSHAKPTTLYIAGRFIHSSDPQAPPIYEFSHSVPFLKDSDRKVVMERLDYSVKRNSEITTRKRPMWDLTHRTVWEMPTYHWQGESSTSRTIGHLGMETFSPKFFGGDKGYRVFKAAKGSDRKLVKETAQTIFTATPPRQEGEVTFEWTDAKDQIIAREIVRDDLVGLMVTVELESEVRDALAAAWIMRIWWDLSRGKWRTSRRESCESRHP